MLTLAGISYKTAPVEVRERLAFGPDELAAVLPSLRDRFGPAVVLSTCNRTEVYLSQADAGASVRHLASFLSQSRGVDVAVDADHFYLTARAEAVRHLFRVSAGAESMVLGEPQILGQVRNALTVAEQAGSADGLLHRLFQNAVGAGRRVRRRTGIAGYAGSVGTVAVELARASLGDLSGRTVLVVSAGEAGKVTAASLLGSGASRLLVTNRTFARATGLAERLGGEAIPFDRLREGVQAADIVISATGARGFQIDRRLVEQVMATRASRPLLLIDLAVPRDVEPAVGALPNVTVHDIDSLQPAMDRFAAADGSPIPRVDALVDQEVARFMVWWNSRQIVPTISALRDRAEAIRKAELAKTLGRLPNLSSEDRGRIEALTAAIVNKMLHEPIARLKQSEDESRYLDAVRDLFALQSVTE